MNCFANRLTSNGWPYFWIWWKTGMMPFPQSMYATIIEELSGHHRQCGLGAGYPRTCSGCIIHSFPMKGLIWGKDIQGKRQRWSSLVSQKWLAELVPSNGLVYSGHVVGMARWRHSDNSQYFSLLCWVQWRIPYFGHFHVIISSQWLCARNHGKNLPYA